MPRSWQKLASSMTQPSAYAQAGVDIDQAHTLMGRVKDSLKQATRPEVLGELGAFGGLFQLSLGAMQEPVLVASVDGVGTKLMVAGMVGRHDTVGMDLVHHCINDIIVQGAEPLFFLDYIGIGKLRSPLYEQVLLGLAKACQQTGVALLGGETAEMPGMYGDDYDLVGAIVGMVDRAKIITGDAVSVGDQVIGLPSNGLHTNGYSLARRVIFDQLNLQVDHVPDGWSESVGEALLHPHVCYLDAFRVAKKKGLDLHALAHLTGGGFYDNIPRVLPAGCGVRIEHGTLPKAPPVFGLIQDGGQIEAEEMYRVFNMGTGMVWIVAADDVDLALACAREAGHAAAHIGEVVAGNDVTIVDL